MTVRAVGKSRHDRVDSRYDPFYFPFKLLFNEQGSFRRYLFGWENNSSKSICKISISWHVSKVLEWRKISYRKSILSHFLATDNRKKSEKQAVTKASLKSFSYLQSAIQDIPGFVPEMLKRYGFGVSRLFFEQWLLLSLAQKGVLSQRTIKYQVYNLN